MSGTSATTPHSWLTLSAVTAALALVIGITSVGASLASDHPTNKNPNNHKSLNAAMVGPDEMVSVELGEMYVKPEVLEWTRGAPLKLVVRNSGTMTHDLKVDGTKGTRMLAPGESEEIVLGPFEADVDAWCTVSGHKHAGMTMHIHVSDSGTLPAVNETGGHTTTASINTRDAPTSGWTARNPLLAPTPSGAEHRITLTASETIVDVAPGVRQEIWSFDGTVPGPTLRGKVGDTFVVTLRNDGKIAHSIDFHASKVAWDDEMRNIGPGESLEYRFVAKHAGAFMYHCGTAPALHHIGNGMYGAIVIDPPDLAPVDHELLFVQSELYTGPQDQPGSLAKMKSESWDAVVFNGYFNQYSFSPIQVEPGQRVRAWVLDAGPSENSAFHVVGTVFDTVYKEGAYRLRPDSSRGGAQALDLQPSQGGFVEFSFDEPGRYPFVTHKFANTGKGAMGMFEAGKRVPITATHPGHMH